MGTGNASVLVSVNSSVAFAVYMGTSSVDNTYLVDIDPAPTAHVLADSSEAYQFNATTPWALYEEVWYVAAGLDRTETYTVTLTNKRSLLMLDRVMFCDAIAMHRAPSFSASVS
ncbi:uncharacterized protein C8Q71DRAFT_387634 [Rhodofomes roseus]|uniref:Uncharacterized protein n=1 Tax=Rhodofomes roseus TaxID=34475 RepID=A0ABQ8K1H8_9APHY|nr:uncharacterized protein C8Q71DRAFT_387634 [Rhodofomes roseus]KAH9830044.1 hypothetical protein C8Q71DRAFT_387634 [Rhodofomes roseus]